MENQNRPRPFPAAVEKFSPTRHRWEPIGVAVRLKIMISWDSSTRPRCPPSARVAMFAVAELIVVALLLFGVPAIASATGARYHLPLAPPATVVRPFDPPEKRWQPGHRGVDLSASPGSIVRAAGAGRVRFAGRVAGRPVVSIAHDGDLITTYEPVEATVRQGQTVRRGDVIGTVDAGHEGCRAAACLHWGARRGRGRAAVYLNPMVLIGAVRIRLKPVAEHIIRNPVMPGDAPDGVRRAGARR